MFRPQNHTYPMFTLIAGGSGNKEKESTTPTYPFLLFSYYSAIMLSSPPLSQSIIVAFTSMPVRLIVTLYVCLVDLTNSLSKLHINTSLLMSSCALFRSNTIRALGTASVGMRIDSKLATYPPGAIPDRGTIFADPA